MRNAHLMSSIKWRVERALPDWAFAVREHWKRHRALPNLIWPSTFNEKVLYRKLFDRRPLLTQLADKAAARSYVEARLGRLVLPELYCLTTCPESIPFDELPDKFVIKPTHASGWVQLVTDKSALDHATTISTCRDWLDRSFYRITREWPYKNIVPRILVEEFIDGGGTAPIDYKLFVFAGNVAIIQVDTDRFTHHRRRLYTREWQKIDVRYEYEDVTQEISEPRHLREMIDAAEILGKDLDFVRVDFYDTVENLYFGELTTTPTCGWDRFEPKSFDGELGARWTLPGRRLLRG